jgi:glycogen debranching enzyme
MLDIIEVGNQYYVRAQSSFADNQTKTLMVGDLFGVFDRRGDFRTLGSSRQGLFYREMRHLSKLVLGLGQGELLLLSSSVRLDNAILAVDLTNAEVPSSGSENRAVRTVHFHRSSFLWANRCYQRIEVQNYAAEPVALELILEFEADFSRLEAITEQDAENCLNLGWKTQRSPLGIWVSTVFGGKLASN